MRMDFVIEQIKGNSFRVVAKDGKKVAGEALFHEHNHVWGVRVDVKPKYQGQGIATELLITGDNYIRQSFPGNEREFKDLNGLTYKRYTDQISDDSIISFDGNSLRFRL